MANGKILVRLFTSWQIIKFNSLIKLTRSSLYIIEKNNWGRGRGLMEKYLET